MNRYKTSSSFYNFKFQKVQILTEILAFFRPEIWPSQMANLTNLGTNKPLVKLKINIWSRNNTIILWQDHNSIVYLKNHIFR